MENARIWICCGARNMDKLSRTRDILPSSSLRYSHNFDSNLCLLCHLNSTCLRCRQKSRRASSSFSGSSETRSTTPTGWKQHDSRSSYYRSSPTWQVRSVTRPCTTTTAKRKRSGAIHASLWPTREYPLGYAPTRRFSRKAWNNTDARLSGALKVPIRLPHETMSLMDPQFARTARVYINSIYWRSSMDILFSPTGAQYLIRMFPPDSALHKLQIYIKQPDPRLIRLTYPIKFIGSFEKLAHPGKHLNCFEVVFGVKKGRTLANVDFTQWNTGLTRITEAILGKAVKMTRVDEVILANLANEPRHLQHNIYISQDPFIISSLL
jgi:hypothetical protein